MKTTRDPDFFATDALPAGPRGAAEPAFRLDIVRSLRMHPTLAAVTALLVTGGLLVGALVLKTQYQATAIFSASPVVMTVLPTAGSNASSDVAQFDSSMQQYVETLQRADTAEAAVRSLSAGVWRHPRESVAQAALRLQRALKASRVGTSLQIESTLTGPTAEGTQAAMSALANAFLKTAHSDEDGRANERVQLLKEEAARLETDLAADRASAAQLAGEFGVSRLQDSEKVPQDQEVGDLRQQLSDLRRAKSYAAAGIGQYGSGRGNDESNQNTTTAGLISQINIRKAQLESQMAGMTAANPIYQQDVQELRSLDRELAVAVNRSDAEQTSHDQTQRNRQVQGVSQEEAVVSQRLAAQTVQASSTAGKLQRYSALNSEISALQSRLAVVRDSISTTQLQANSPSRVVLAVAPNSAEPAVSTKRRLALLAAVPLGLLAGLLAAVLAQRQDGRVFLAVDLQQVLGVHPMAVLPAASQVSDTLSEQGLLRMAGSIESAFLKSRSKTFVFTASSADSEVEELVFRVQGKLKELGYSALWLSAETLLRAERDFEELYGRGPVSGSLRFSEAKGTDGDSVEGIAVKRLNWLRRDYDMVLVDAPPLLVSAMAEYAVRRTDAAILVSESGVTTREELTACAALLERLGAHGIGSVLQGLQVRFAAPGYKRELQKAEELAALPVQREPFDNAGEWQVLHAGTPNELHVPGDPTAMRRTSRARPRYSRSKGARVVTTASLRKTGPSTDWKAEEELLDEARYTSVE